VVVGVSGGPDSVCLLHVLGRLAPEYELGLHAAHLHHGLRGTEADADADFVHAIAGRWGVPVTTGHTDVAAVARRERRAVEEAARRARYAFLREVAAGIGAGIIAVGHNADDQAETVLMHFVRGSGLAGLRGMRPRTRLSHYRLPDVSIEAHAATPGERSTELPIYLIRPLLYTTRTAIEAYNEAHDLEPRFDRSNLDTTYFRNWLRHKVLPLLEMHNPGVKDVIRRTAEVVTGDYALLRSLLEDAWPEVVIDEVAMPAPQAGDEAAGGRIVMDLERWRALPPALQRSTLREAIHRLRRSLRNINFVHVEDAVRVAREGTTGDQATLPRGLMLTVGYDTLRLADAGAAPVLPDLPLLLPDAAPLPVALPGTTPLPGGEWLLHARLLQREALPPGWDENADPWQAFLDTGALGAVPHLRPRRPGDRFQPLGMGGQTVKLADFLTNQKVAHAVRDRLPLLVGVEGIAWVGGQRVDERARVRPATERVAHLRFELT
jgi:tRNA(Ile)-lysidine synthase